MSIAEIKSTIRDIKMKSVLDQDFNKNFEIDIPKFNPLYKGNKYVKQLNSLGGILTGSRALSFYRINNHPIINRKPDDWDYILDKKSFLSFCSINNIGDYKHKEDGGMTTNFKTGIRTGYSYDGDEKTYIFKHLIDIFTSDDITSYIEYRGWKIATLSEILESKLKLIERNIDSEKHKYDCNLIIAKISTHLK